MSCPENITSLKGIGEKTAGLFHRLGIYDTGELLSYYPRSYETFEPPVKLSDAPAEKNGYLRAVSSRGLQMEKSE